MPTFEIPSDIVFYLEAFFWWTFRSVKGLRRQDKGAQYRTCVFISYLFRRKGSPWFINLDEVKNGKLISWIYP